MIKGLGKVEGQDVIVLGLSHENVARLFANEPIAVRTAAPPPDGVSLEGGPVIVLLAGSDEDAITAQLRSAFLVTDETNVTDGR